VALHVLDLKDMSTTDAAIEVLLFASYADAFGGRKVKAPIAAPCTVSALVDAMRTLPGGSRLPVRPLVAVNQRWSPPDHVITAGDEVAVIPPVAGG
jgi:molybdopterin converting factor small subunit